MFNELEYQTVWMIYLATAACCWLVWTQMTRWIGWWFIREPLWLVMAVLLFTPARIDPLEPWLAPAVMGWLLDTFIGSGEHAPVLLSELALALMIAVLSYIAFASLRQAWRHWRSSSRSTA